MRHSAEELEQYIVGWAKDRGILDSSTSKDQFIKTIEEIGELGKALGKRNDAGIIDGLGDAVVTLILLAKLEGYSLNDCVNAAWNEIKNRQGKMVNGLFVKEEV